MRRVVVDQKKKNKVKDSERGREPSSKPDLLMELLLASRDFL